MASSGVLRSVIQRAGSREVNCTLLRVRKILTDGMGLRRNANEDSEIMARI